MKAGDKKAVFALNGVSVGGRTDYAAPVEGERIVEEGLDTAV